MATDLEKALGSLQLNDNNSEGVIENEPPPNLSDERPHDEVEREKLWAKERDELTIS